MATNPIAKPVLPVPGFYHPVLGKTVKLGRTVTRRTSKSRMRAAKMHDFLSSLPTAPETVDNTFGLTSFGEMGNDVYGCCTEAAKGHLIQSWTAGTGSEVTLPDSVILSAYETECGYVPGNPSTDQGGDILTVLSDWEQNGLGGHFIEGHAEVNITQMRIQQAIYLFGGVDVGLMMPLSAQTQVGKLWDIVNFNVSGDAAANSWGGHSVAIVGYSPAGLTCITWGQLQQMTWKWFEFYCEEAHAVISKDMKGVSADLVALGGDLQQIGS